MSDREDRPCVRPRPLPTFREAVPAVLFLAAVTGAMVALDWLLWGWRP